MRKLLKEGKSHSEGFEVTVLGAGAELGIEPAPPARMQNLVIPGAVGRVLRKGTISPRLNNALASVNHKSKTHKNQTDSK